MLHFLRRVGLARLLRLGLTLAIPPPWYEIAVLHYRGAFQNRFMWVPVLSLPVVMASGVASSLKMNERHSQDIFRPFAWFMTVMGTLGTLFHLRGIARQMGGFHNWKYNVVTGPPFLAPMQIALFGLLGVVASGRLPHNFLESKHSDEAKLVRQARWINSFSYLLIAIEAGVQKEREILEAAGAEVTWTEDDTAHLMGSCRMGSDPKTSVVDPWCRSWDIPNLFVCDGSVFVTSSAVNPSLTIQAIATRTADYIIDRARTGDFFSRAGERTLSSNSLFRR